jgi:streptogramin lyase
LIVLGCGNQQAAVSPSPADVTDINLGGPGGQEMTFAFGSLWIAMADKGSVARLDPKTNSVKQIKNVGDPAKMSPRAHVGHGTPNAVASGFDSIWAVGADQTLSRIDPRTDKVVSSVDIGVVGIAVAIDDTAVWISSYDDGALVRFDPAAGKVSSTTRQVGGLMGLATGFGSVWAASKSGHELVRFDAKSGAVTARIPTARNPDFVAIGAGSTWVIREQPPGILRVDPTSNSVVATIPAEASWGMGVGLTFADDSLWTGFLVRIDPASGQVAKSLAGSHGDSDSGVVIGGDSAWVLGLASLHRILLSRMR